MKINLLKQYGNGWNIWMLNGYSKSDLKQIYGLSFPREIRERTKGKAVFVPDARSVDIVFQYRK